jgi:hypothetical protein
MSKHFNPLANRKDDEGKVSLGKATIIKTTDKAINVRLDGVGTIWIPESVVHDDSEVFKGCDGSGDLIVLSWWAEQEGLS